MRTLTVFLSVILGLFVFSCPVWSSSISTVSTVGEAQVTITGNDRAAAFKKAVREALKDAVRKEASLLVDNPQDLADIEVEIDSRLKDFVVKYQVLEARFVESQGGSQGNGEVQGKGPGSWYVKVKAFVDSDLLQRAVVESEPVEEE